MAPGAASRAMPIAARPTSPRGDSCGVVAAARVAGIAALAGTIGDAVVTAAATDPPDWWMQWYWTIASALCPQMVLLHISYPSAPHCITAVLSDIHSHGAVQAGASTPDVTRVPATIPISAPTVPHMIATIPRITTILTYRFPSISDHRCLTGPGREPGFKEVDTGDQVIEIPLDQHSWNTGRVFPSCATGCPPRKAFLQGHASTLMEPARENLKSVLVRNAAGEYLLTLDREDFSPLYPRMERYVLAVREGDRLRAVFRTNTFEYSPLSPLAAATAAEEMAARWERELAEGPAALFRNFPLEPPRGQPGPVAGVVIIQGSPRPDGNCGILAGWAAEAAQAAGRTCRVIYPHDLDIHPCIGCYQCYNTGTCVFDDDMVAMIDAVRRARLLIVCSPVYTNTVPAGLKLVIDRMQAYHAERTLFGGGSGQKGIIFSVAGRKGGDNFTCVTKVISAFFQNLSIEPAGQVLIDSMDAVRDIRLLPGREDSVKGLVSAGLHR